MISKRLSLFAIALFASPLVVGSTFGCAGTVVQETSTAENAKHDPEQRGYDVGFDRGKSAAARGATPDSKMPGKHDAETSAAYSRGYDDGYAGRENRYGSVQVREWMSHDDDENTPENE